MYTSKSTFLSETIFRACEQILLSESLEEDLSGFCFFLLPLDGVIALLKIDRLDDEEEDDEIFESDDSGSSGKPVENYLVDYVNPQNLRDYLVYFQSANHSL